MKTLEKRANFNNNFNIIKYILKLSNNITKGYLSKVVLLSVLKATYPFITIVFTKLLVDELMLNKRIHYLLILVVIYSLGNLAVNILIKILSRNVELKNLMIFKAIELRLGVKSLELDFEMVEDPKILDLKESAIFPIKNEAAIQNLIEDTIGILSESIFSLFSIIAISIFSPILALFIVLIIILTNRLFIKIQDFSYKLYQDVIPLSRKFGYFANLTSDFSIGKDIRLYNMAPLFIKKITTFFKSIVTYLGDMEIYSGKMNGLIAIIDDIKIAIIYLYLVFKTYTGSISISDLFAYTLIVNKLNISFGEILKKITTISQFAKYLDKFVQYDSIKTNNTQGRKELEKDTSYSIEFNNVSFKYPGAKEYVLNNINIKIMNYENLAIVGLNGAGKTTFIKLLSKLYKPTEGQILLNGVNIESYSNSSYMKILSIVFQDFTIFPFSAKENIVFEDNNLVLNQAVTNILKSIDTNNDIVNLHNGIDTNLYKIFDKNGVELSGGQAQKIALARAIYKNAPIIILDEPTAALDPIAEHDIYTQFHKIVENKTAIYISHRLSSCKFCDNIAVFNDGTITEYGTHTDLMKKKGSLYEKMYTTQAQYYI